MTAKERVKVLIYVLVAIVAILIVRSCNKGAAAIELPEQIIQLNESEIEKLEARKIVIDDEIKKKFSELDVLVYKRDSINIVLSNATGKSIQTGLDSLFNY